MTRQLGSGCIIRSERILEHGMVVGLNADDSRAAHQY